MSAMTVKEFLDAYPELKGECPVCSSVCINQYFINLDAVFYSCPICGRFQISPDLFSDNRLAPYLFYNRFLQHKDLRYHTTLSQEECDAYNEQLDENVDPKKQLGGRPVHVDANVLANWYPKTFAERVDFILKRVCALAGHIGSWVPLTEQELLSLFFVDRYEIPDGNCQSTRRSNKDCRSGSAYMSMVLQDRKLVDILPPSTGEERKIRLLPEGYARVDELQKDDLGGKRVFVAMKFGKETVALRKAIENGVTAAGYFALPIDQTEHNEFIPLEILKQIRDSRFVVVDLSDDNRGAYFEEGYAMGIGKPVIQLCKRSKAEGLHFDLRQKNTILWETEDDIPEPLKKRILATIE